MQPIKGFRDFVEDDALKREALRKIIAGAFLRYGFAPAETPIIEYEKFVKGDNEKDEAVSDIFKLQDKGKRELALRYEFTFQLKRLAKNKKLPFKRFQVGEVFRDEPVSSNRFRQFTQCDADVVGSSLKDEAELMRVVKEIMDSLGIEFKIYFNSRKLLNEILEEGKVEEKVREEVIREIDKLDKLSFSEVEKNLKKFGAERVLKVFKNKESYFEKYNFYKEIKELKNFCKDFGVELEFSPSLARGLSYYNGSVFEVKTKKMKETICAGGAYFVDKIQAVGVSFGLDRLVQLADFEKVDFSYLKPEYLVLSIGQDKKAISVAQSLRDKGKNCVLVLDKSVSKALEYANSRGIAKVVFVGEEEVKSKKFKVKDMVSGEESFLED